MLQFASGIIYNSFATFSNIICIPARIKFGYRADYKSTVLL